MAEYKPENIIERLRHTINTGKYGKDYAIIPRDKNNSLREKYLIDDSKVKAILLDLNPDDYIESGYSDNDDFINDIVHIFGKEVQLIPRNSEKIDYEKVKLYIKFTWTDSGNGKYLIIISFHKWNDI